MTTALVTGPTAGIGRQFAYQLAARGADLILVSRDERRLSALATEIGDTYGVTTEVLAADLSDRAATEQVERRLAEKARPIDYLINNAGFGLRESFLDTSVDQEQARLDVLVTAPMRLTHAAAPGMIERGFGRIVVVSSFASWIANGTYSAAKAWATVFVEGLQAELRDTGVHATALCPGFVHTEIHQRAEIDVSSIPDRMWLDAESVVATALADCDKGRVLSVPGRQYSVLAPIVRTTPRFLVRRIRR